jgi:hypothetical protein
VRPAHDLDGVGRRSEHGGVEPPDERLRVALVPRRGENDHRFPFWHEVRRLPVPESERQTVALVQGRAGEIVGVEVKLSATVDDDDIAHLRWLRDELKGDLRAAVVITTGPHAYRRPDGIYVVPLALLGP